LATEGQEVQRAEDVIKDPYVLEFLNLPQQERYLEGDLEREIINNLQTFLLELGKGFAFIGRQYKVTLGGRHFFVDLVFYHRIFAVTFDETFARATGMNAGLYNMVIALLTALVIVIGMRMMGSLLISSLVVFPAVTSMRTCLTFRSVMICSAVVSTVCLTAGLVISYLCAAPTGASIVLCNIAAFILFAAVQKGRECLQSSKKSL
jgi:hypothetical protein